MTTVECPVCDGMGYTEDDRSELYELAPGVLSMRCLTCMGDCFVEVPR